MVSSEPIATKGHSDTAPKLSRTRGLRPFKPGFDPNRNLKGRPKNFDHFRALALKIAAEDVERDGKRMCAAEALLRDWKESPEPTLQKAFAEYGFGKVPDKNEITGPEGESLKPMVIQVITHAPKETRIN